MCLQTSVTVLCALCQVAPVDRHYEFTQCRDVQRGKPCRRRASGNVNFRTDVGRTFCPECTEQILREAEDRRRAAAAQAGYVYPVSTTTAAAGATLVMSRYGESGPLGDRELTLNTQWRWDPRYSPPASSVTSPTTTESASTPSTPSASNSSSQHDSDSQRSASRSGSVDERRSENQQSSEQSSESSKPASSNTSSQELPPPNMGGDRNLYLHSALYWQ